MHARKVVVEEDWEVLKAFFPADWQDLARQSGALKGLRQDKSAEPLLRTLLLHVGGGHSLRETAVRAQAAGWAHLSDVALFKRLRKSKAWLQRLCEALVAERRLPAAPAGPRWRLIDATVVQEPGPRGGLWRLHYSFQWPTLACDFFRLTAGKGPGTGESLRPYPFQAGECVLADRGYCHGPGLQAAARQGAFVTVRLNPHTVRLQNADGSPFALGAHLESLPTPGQVGEWPVWVATTPGQPPLAARVCALRKSQAATALAQRKVKRKARKNGSRHPRPEALRQAQYVLVLTTLPPADFSAAQVLAAYRYRWQVELVFKRFKQLLGLGHLPKSHPDSVQAWLYGKLFLALLTEKLIAHARAVSPWGYAWPGPALSQPLA